MVKSFFIKIGVIFLSGFLFTAYATDNKPIQQSQPPLSQIDKNKQTIKNLYDAINNQLVDKIPAYFENNYTLKFVGNIHGRSLLSTLPMTTHNLKIKLTYLNYLLPNHQTHIIDMISEGPRLFVYTLTTANKISGLLGILTPSNSVKITNFLIYEFNDSGKITQVTQLWNEPNSEQELVHFLL